MTSSPLKTSESPPTPPARSSLSKWTCPKSPKSPTNASNQNGKKQWPQRPWCAGRTSAMNSLGSKSIQPNATSTKSTNSFPCGTSTPLSCGTPHASQKCGRFGMRGSGCMRRYSGRFMKVLVAVIPYMQ